MPEYVDRDLKCCDCTNDFTFSAGEQEYFAKKEFTNTPRRCKPCRDARKVALGQPVREAVEYPITCAACGQDATIPFVPRKDLPVFCQPCFKAGAAEGREVRA